MAGKRTEMSKIKQILLLHKDGMSNRKIGERLGLYKETVNKYVNAAKSDSKSIEELIKMEEPELQHRFSAGNAAYSDKRFDALQEDLEYYVRELERRHVTMLLLWEEYRQKHPDGYGYTQFCYHLNQHKASADPEVSLPMSNFREGGNELFIDFAGGTMSYVDLDTGEEVKCQIFVACLPASDYGYAMAVPSQKVEDFLHALSSCLRHIGGVPRILVTDNLKSSVTRPDRYMPELNVIMEDFANHYGCVTIPARSGHPKDKALVEDQVRIVYRRVYAPLRNEMFHSIQELNMAISEKMKQHNQKRMQRLPFTREERFLSLDRPRLRELPEKDFEIIYRTELLVQNSSHIYMGRDKVYYSVPYHLIGKKVKVIYTRSLVKIFSPEGERVAVHMRCTVPGRYCTVDAHMPSYYNDYVNLSPQKYIDRAAAVSESLATVIRRLFGNNPYAVPEQYYKSCDGLFHLQRTTNPELFEKACRAAIEFDACRYPFIKNLIESKCAGLDNDEESTLFPETHANIRGKEYFADK